MDASLPTGLGRASPTQEATRTSCKVVVQNGIIRRGGKSPRNRGANCPPCTTNMSFPKGHLMFSLAEECESIRSSTTMNLGEYLCTWINTSCPAMSKNSSPGRGPRLPWGYSGLWILRASFVCLSTPLRGCRPLLPAMGMRSGMFPLFVFATVCNRNSSESWQRQTAQTPVGLSRIAR